MKQTARLADISEADAKRVISVLPALLPPNPQLRCRWPPGAATSHSVLAIDLERFAEDVSASIGTDATAAASASQ